MPHPAIQPPLPAGESTTVELYGPDFTAMFAVPSDAISQMPSRRLNVTRLVACSNFAKAVTATNGARLSDKQWCEAACSAGVRCRFVHVNRPLSEFPARTIHVHYIWQSLESVTYNRVWGGPCEDAPTVWLMNPPDCRAEVKRYDEQRARSTARALADGIDPKQHDKQEDERVAFAMMVDLIASVAPVMRIPATRLLQTAGSVEYLRRRLEGVKPDYSLAPCPGYTCHNECKLGEQCPDAHVINLDVSQSTPFVRRTLRHVKAASEATMVRNEGRVESGLFGMVSRRSNIKVVSTGDPHHHATPQDTNNTKPGNSSSESPGATKSSIGFSKSSIRSSTQQTSVGDVVVGASVTGTESSRSPTQFNASTLGDLTPSTGNSGGGSGGSSGGSSSGSNGDGSGGTEGGEWDGR